MDRETVLVTAMFWIVIRSIIALFMGAVNFIARVTGAGKWSIIAGIALMVALNAANQPSTAPAPVQPVVVATVTAHHGLWASFATHWLIVGGILGTLVLAWAILTWLANREQTDAYAPRRIGME